MKRLAWVLCVACGGQVEPPPEDASVDGTLTADSSADAGDAVASIWPDAALAEACRDAGWIIHVESDGGFGMDSSATITGDVGTWSCALSNDSFLRLNVYADASWGINATSDWQNGQSMEAGTYTSSGDTHFGSWIQVEVAGRACNLVPTGTFTIYELATDQGEPAAVSKLLMTFELRCNGQGSLVGCARFGD